MIPSVGRIVHAILPQGHPNAGGHRAAQITAAYPDTKGSVSDASPVDLRITLMAHEKQGQSFAGPEGFIDLEHVFQDPQAMKAGTWHEPERVETFVAARKPQPA